MFNMTFQDIMDGLEFRKRGREMVDYIVDYLDNIDARRVTPNIEPGYLQDLIPPEPPTDPEEWDNIMDDIEKKIMIGVRILKKTQYKFRNSRNLHIIADDPLATPAFSRLFSRGQFLSFHPWGHVGRCNWMCGIFLGINYI